MQEIWGVTLRGETESADPVRFDLNQEIHLFFPLWKSYRPDPCMETRLGISLCGKEHPSRGQTCCVVTIIMQKTFKQSVGLIAGTLGGFSRITDRPGVLGGILFLTLLHNNPGQVLSATPPGPYSVALTWDRSPDSSVTGYRVYYGGASGDYTNGVTLGNVTSNTVSGLVSGVTYFFAIVAYNATGLESSLSNEISFVPGLARVGVRMTSNRQAVLTVKGLIGQTYDILATQTFGTWTVIGSVTLGAAGSMEFTDVNAANFPRRFYRTKQRP